VPYIRVTQDYFTVFHALCPKIGLLRPLNGEVVLTSEVVQLYTVGKALLEDVHTLREIYERARSGQGIVNHKELLARSQSVKRLFQDILERGPQVVNALAAYAARRWWGIFP
jgi:hypothetical protein